MTENRDKCSPTFLCCNAYSENRQTTLYDESQWMEYIHLVNKNIVRIYLWLWNSSTNTIFDSKIQTKGLRQALSAYDRTIGTLNE